MTTPATSVFILLKAFVFHKHQNEKGKKFDIPQTLKFDLVETHQ